MLADSDKCVFIYNANKNRFAATGSRAAGSASISPPAPSATRSPSNAFVGNQTQVMYVGTRYLDWSERGRGNYWSDNPAFDLNGDGIADTAYRPNDVIDQVIWRAPAAKLLLNSPAVQVVRWAQSAFPAIHPGRRYRQRAAHEPPVRRARIGVARRRPHDRTDHRASSVVSKSLRRIDAVP